MIGSKIRNKLLDQYFDFYYYWLDMQETSETVDLRFLFLGVANLCITILSLIWLLGTFLRKRQFTLQFQLFFFLSMNRLCRTINLLVFSQICAFSRTKMVYCLFIMRFYQTLDLLASALNFSAFLTLVSFWAEQYHSIRLKDSEDFANDFQKMTTRIKIVFWSFTGLAYGSWLICLILIFSLNGGFDSYSIAYLTVRTLYRVFLSVSISLFVIVYGYLLFVVQNDKVKKVFFFFI